MHRQRSAASDPQQLASPLRYAPLVQVLAACAAGIMLDRMLDLGARVGAVSMWSISAFASVAWLVAWRLHRGQVAATCLIVSLAALGGVWHHGWWRLYPRDELAGAATADIRPIVVEAVALGAPRHIPAPPPDPLKAINFGARSRFEVRVVALRNIDGWHSAEGTALVLVEGELTGVRAGDRLRIFAQLSKAQPAANPGDLDFVDFARAQRRLTLLRAEFTDSVDVIERGSPWSWRNGLDVLRQGSDRLLWRHIHRDRAGLAAALLLGAREQLDAERTAAFVRTNTIHVLAISGMHIAILAGCLFLGLRSGLLPRRLALLAVVAATLLYTLLTDSDPSAVRAMILVFLVCSALWAGRPAEAFNCWAAGGLFVLALNPADLFRSGPQLSFLAVAAMAWLAPRWSRHERLDPLDRLILETRPWPQRAARWLGRWFWRATVVTFAVWFVSVPLVAARFHAVSPAAILLSTILFVPIAVALISGFGVLLLGWCPPLAAAAGWVCDQSLWAADSCVRFASQLPGSYFWVPGPEPWWLAGFYLDLLAWALLPSVRIWRAMLAFAAWGIVGLVPPAISSWQEKPFTCTFLSVGHGTSVVLHLPDGKTVLYDAGRLGSPAGGARSIAGYLWSLGIMRLDAVIVSHADVDHYNALPELLEQFRIEQIYVSPQMFADDAEPLQILRTAIDRSGAILSEVSAGESIDLGDTCTCDVLHPPAAGVAGNDNAQSIVLAIEYGGSRVLLTGDLEGAGMASLLAQPEFDCDVMLAPHHGSVRSNPPGIAAWSRPEFVVISGGRSSDHAEPVAAAYRTRGAEVFHTAYDGAVRFRFLAEGIDAAHWSDGAWRRRATNGNSIR